MKLGPEVANEVTEACYCDYGVFLPQATWSLLYTSQAVNQ